MSNQVVGTCLLCDANAPLINGHIIPAWSYRRASVDSSDGLVHLKGESAAIMSKQLREYMLCNQCEQVFSVWENYASSMAVQEDRTFPWLSGSPVLAAVGDDKYVDSSNLDADALCRFAASVIWRASVSRRACPKLWLGKYEGAFKAYLRRERDFPGAANLVTYLLTAPRTFLPPADRIVLTPTQIRHDGYSRYFFVLCGVAFYMFVGPRQPPLYRRRCFARRKHVFTMASDRLMDEVHGFIKASTPRGALARKKEAGLIK